MWLFTIPIFPCRKTEALRNEATRTGSTMQPQPLALKPPVLRLAFIMCPGDSGCKPQAPLHRAGIPYGWVLGSAQAPSSPRERIGRLIGKPHST